jgi:glycosyltransferase involved in cell wall biosynthesis
VTPMRVLLDVTFAHRAPHSGTGIYLDRLQAALADRDEVTVLAVADRRRRAPGGGGAGSLRNALADADWVHRRLPRLADRHRADVIHHPLPALAREAGRAQVITVHDLAFLAHPEAFDRSFRAWAGWSHGHAARRADALICVSDATRAEVQARWGVATERLTVAPHGPGQALPAAPRTDPRHFLYVGDGEPRKNLPLLLAAYARYRSDAGPRALELVLAGAAAGDGPGVRLERDPGVQRLAALHAEAAALVHPARHEGFGLTLLEAMAVGTPVVALDGAAVREVCGDAAWLVPGPDPDVLARAMSALAADPGRRLAMARRGRSRVTRFSWARCAERHVTAYLAARAAYSSRRRR